MGSTHTSREPAPLPSSDPKSLGKGREAPFAQRSRLKSQFILQGNQAHAAQKAAAPASQPPPSSRPQSRSPSAPHSPWRSERHVSLAWVPGQCLPFPLTKQAGPGVRKGHSTRLQDLQEEPGRCGSLGAPATRGPSPSCLRRILPSSALRARVPLCTTVSSPRPTPAPADAPRATRPGPGLSRDPAHPAEPALHAARGPPLPPAPKGTPDSPGAAPALAGLRRPSCQERRAYFKSCPGPRPSDSGPTLPARVQLMGADGSRSGPGGPCALREVPAGVAPLRHGGPGAGRPPCPPCPRASPVVTAGDPRAPRLQPRTLGPRDTHSPAHLPPLRAGTRECAERVGGQTLALPSAFPAADPSLEPAPRRSPRTPRSAPPPIAGSHREALGGATGGAGPAGRGGRCSLVGPRALRMRFCERRWHLWHLPSVLCAAHTDRHRRH